MSPSLVNAGNVPRTRRLNGKKRHLAPRRQMHVSVTLRPNRFRIKSAVIDPTTIEQVIAGLKSGLPSGVTQDLEKNLRAALTAVFARHNLVTREELEVQTAVLARTRARLEELEKQVAELEKALLKK
jgi:hypothetical protein